MSEPLKALQQLKKTLKKNGGICVVDIDDSWLNVNPKPTLFESYLHRVQNVQKLEVVIDLINMVINFKYQLVNTKDVNNIEIERDDILKVLENEFAWGAVGFILCYR